MANRGHSVPSVWRGPWQKRHRVASGMLWAAAEWLPPQIGQTPVGIGSTAGGILGGPQGIVGGILMGSWRGIRGGILGGPTGRSYRGPCAPAGRGFGGPAKASLVTPVTTAP